MRHLRATVVVGTALGVEVQGNEVVGMLVMAEISLYLRATFRCRVRALGWVWRV